MALTAELRSAPLAASAVVCKNDGAYVGYIVSVVTAAATIFVRDGSDASGAIIDVIPVATAVGASRNLAVPIKFKTGMFVDFNGGTGTITFLYN